MKKKRKIILFLAIILFIFIIVSLFLYYHFEINYKRYVTFDSRIDNLNNYKVANSELVGWIQVQGTDIDYPIIIENIEASQSGIDYLWYPYTNVKGENRETIYGHNILNVSSNPLIRNPNHTRFEQLLGFVYYDYAKDNLYIQYTKDNKDEIYKIYAVSFLYKFEEGGETSNNEEEITNYIENAKKNSIYDYDVDVNSNDHIISLITCTRYFGVSGKTTFKIDARKLRKNEKIKKYSVEPNQNYDIIK